MVCGLSAGFQKVLDEEGGLIFHFLLPVGTDSAGDPALAGQVDRLLHLLRNEI
jgi:hypothetical protein